MMALARKKTLKPSAFQNYSMIKRRKNIKKPKGRVEESMNGFMEKYTRGGWIKTLTEKKSLQNLQKTYIETHKQTIFSPTKLPSKN
jgi:hypothetical protein